MVKKKIRKDKTYEVERIRAVKLENGKFYFLIKWKNYSYKKNSWEPLENLNEVALASIQNFPIPIPKKN